MIKICVVTSSRSDYGLLKWLMNDIKDSDEFELQLIVTGGHLLYDQGHTIDQIIEDGYVIDYTIDVKLNSSDKTTIAEAMGRMAESFAGAFEKLKPNYLLLLGDRYELLPICSTAFVMCIPIIHLSGGDVTEGAIDDGIRNAVTMLAKYHFPGTIDAAKNIIRMRGRDDNVWAVGEPGLDAFNREKLLTKIELTKDLNLDAGKKWALMTYHAETRKSLEYNMDSVKNCIKALTDIDNLQTVITYANTDFGGKEINNYIEAAAEEYPDKIIVVPSLGHIKYLSFMRQVDFVIGNSSSGIVEAPFMNIPVINIGDRQKGRYQSGNIIQCGTNQDDIKAALDRADGFKNEPHTDLDYWGDGHTSERIMEILKNELKV